MLFLDAGKRRACACALPERVVHLLSAPAAAELYDVIFDVLNNLAENGTFCNLNICKNIRRKANMSMRVGEMRLIAMVTAYRCGEAAAVCASCSAAAASCHQQPADETRRRGRTGRGQERLRSHQHYPHRR